jgi:hypothetical protein
VHCAANQPQGQSLFVWFSLWLHQFFLFDLLAMILKKKNWHTAGMLCLVIGALGAIAAVITGPEGEKNPIFPQHES